jgi:hypothetical protein
MKSRMWSASSVAVATVERGVALLDGDGRQNPGDLVDVRPVDALQELAHVRRHRFDEPSLPLGIQRVEGQRGLAGAGRTGQYRELALRDVNVDVLEVVRPRPANGDRA